ncbi:CLUMA_CG009448, isoform A [Clunio marinus]|uniref:CLUMA_CG009448, isoform A n=1 Tax=Clunio marinus TaxID=568069 RepID=A0A1J1I6X4_9DIPT|nr:CLUMA_CG009448, isoform A [Clunio marinus]
MRKYLQQSKLSETIHSSSYKPKKYQRKKNTINTKLHERVENVQRHFDFPSLIKAMSGYAYVMDYYRNFRRLLIVYKNIITTNPVKEPSTEIDASLIKKDNPPLWSKNVFRSFNNDDDDDDDDD